MSSAIAFLGDDVGLQVRGEELVAVPALFLGLVQRDIGVDQHLARVGCRALGLRNPDRDAAAAIEAFEVERLAHLVDDLVGERRQLVDRSLPPCQHHEFIAADAGDEIAARHVFHQDAGSMHQHGITSRMAERVVDFLEAVEVEMQDRELRRLAVAIACQRVEFEVELTAVRERCQRVVQGVELDAVLGELQLDVAHVGFRLGIAQLFGKQRVGGHVEGNADQLLLAVAPDMRLADRADVANFAILQHHSLCRVDDLVERDRPLCGKLDLAAVVRMKA